MKTAAMVLGAALSLTSVAFPQEEPKTPPRTGAGSGGEGTGTPVGQIRISSRVYVGDRAPDFELPGSKGRPVKLSRLRGDWVLLTFADRKEALASLREIQEDMSSLGVVIVGLCREKPQTLVSFAKRDSLPFTLVADPTGEIAAVYGLFDAGRTTIRPGFMLIDRLGIVKMGLFGQAVPPDQIAALTRLGVTSF